MADSKAKTKGKRSAPARRVTAEAWRFPLGLVWFLLLIVTVGAAAFPVIATRLMNQDGALPVAELSEGALFAPLCIWLVAVIVGLVWSRPRVFSGDRCVVVLTLLLLGLGVVEQLRLGTWVESWVAWRAYLPLLAGLAAFLGGVRFLSGERLGRLLPRLKWVAWLAAMGVLGGLFVFGRAYRGGLFLPGQMNPTELVKVCLVLFGAAWLPARREELSRTLCGVPFPPIKTALALAFVWGVPVVGAVAVRDLGLVLILCLTLVLMLVALTRRVGWLVVGVSAAAVAGWAVRLVSAHTRARFDVWANPFLDPLGKGWQIGQSLCAQYAGGLWGCGLGEGTPGAVPIVSSDFVYAGIAEEWGLVGCALLLGLFWLWLVRIATSARGAEAPREKRPRARATTAAESETLPLLGAGIAAVLGVQIVLNLGGVTKALPMTGITLPFFSQGGFSLLSVLILSGLAVACGKASGPARRG